MAHAEKCPVCYGEGEVIDKTNIGASIADATKKKCHGCGGLGWVTVRD